MKPALLWLEHVMGFERFWDVEELEQSGAGLIGPHPWRRWSNAHSEAGWCRGDPKPGRPAPHGASRVRRKVTVRVGDPRRDVPHGRDLGEINPHRTVAGFAHGGYMSFKQTALAKPTRRRESNRDAVGGGVLQRVELASPVDEVGAGHGPLIDERIHRT